MKQRLIKESGEQGLFDEIRVSGLVRLDLGHVKQDLLVNVFEELILREKSLLLVIDGVLFENEELQIDVLFLQLAVGERFEHLLNAPFLPFLLEIVVLRLVLLLVGVEKPRLIDAELVELEHVLELAGELALLVASLQKGLLVDLQEDFM